MVAKQRLMQPHATVYVETPGWAGNGPQAQPVECGICRWM